jgi:hypothetical protein
VHGRQDVRKWRWSVKWRRWQLWWSSRDTRWTYPEKRISLLWIDKARDKDKITKEEVVYVSPWTIIFISLWIKKERVKDNTYIWGSVWWKTQKLKMRNLHDSHTLGCVIPTVIHT